MKFVRIMKKLTRKDIVRSQIMNQDVNVETLWETLVNEGYSGMGMR